jgi:phosphoribosylanthranilate isomerase
MINTFVKICGVCNLEDALTCASAGANAIGILLQRADRQYDSTSDKISIEMAVELVRMLPIDLKAICLIHKNDRKFIFNILEIIRPWGAQFQKPIEPAALAEIKEKHPKLFMIKTFHISATSNFDGMISDISRYLGNGCIDAVLLDSESGGSGQTHDWFLSKQIVEALGQFPVIVAGGLNSQNVSLLLDQVSPWGVDVMSGVTSEMKSSKSPDKVRSFVQAVRSTGNIGLAI